MKEPRGEKSGKGGSFPFLFFSHIILFLSLLMHYPAMDSVVFFDDKTVDEPEASRSLLVRNLNRGLRVEALLEELEVSHYYFLLFLFSSFFSSSFPLLTLFFVLVFFFSSWPVCPAIWGCAEHQLPPPA